jgi:CheY-like chemotaxis protein
MAPETYATFIDEAFIKPIRSVLIVDDDYPTFEDMLSEDEPADEKDWRKNRENRERVKRVIASFRAKGRNLLVDIHDGKNVGLAEQLDTASHLHQSDLLVLDFQLDKSRQRDGTIAVNIIRRLMTNSHFNLIVVHTSDVLDYVFDQIVLGMLTPDATVLTDAEIEKIEETIDACEDATPGFRKRLTDSMSAAQYIETRRAGIEACFRPMILGHAPFGDFHAVCDEKKWPPKIRLLAFKWAVSNASKSLLHYAPDPNLPRIVWSAGPVKWVQSGTAFIAFSSKVLEEAPLIELCEALNDWRPDPSRLYLARLRYEIDERGTADQASVLGNRHALAAWYDQILRADPDHTGTRITQTIGRLAESLMGPVTSNVAKFAARLVAAERIEGDFDALVRRHFGVDLTVPTERLKAIGQHNSVVSTKRREGWHLTTGHIFECDGKHWICASPACEMVPSQLSKFRRSTYKERVPFTAIRLQPLPLEQAVGIANSARVLFVEIGGKIHTFCYNHPDYETSAPQWAQLYAENLGRLDAETFAFDLIQVEAGEAGLHAKGRSATVVSQLRYEYALNLVQRLGVSMTRIGLDYQEHRIENPEGNMEDAK